MAYNNTYGRMTVCSMYNRGFRAAERGLHEKTTILTHYCNAFVYTYAVFGGKEQLGQ